MTFGQLLFYKHLKKSSGGLAPAQRAVLTRRSWGTRADADFAPTPAKINEDSGPCLKGCFSEEEESRHRSGTQMISGAAANTLGAFKTKGTGARSKRRRESL